MKFIKNVIGNELSSQPLILGKDTVYIHTNIIQKPTQNPNSEIYTEWIYDELQMTYSEYEFYLSAIDKTKQWVMDELEKGMEHQGKMYTVTLDKQNLLSAQLGMYFMNAQNDQEFPLMWNSTGEISVPWLFDDLLQLSNAIAEHVAPIVKRQQETEIKIKHAKSISEIEKILDEFK